MTEILNTAYGKTVETTMDAEETMAALTKIAEAGLLTKPLRLRCKETGEDTWGHCDTDFDEDGEALGHDIIISVLNDGLLAHEIAHALVNETLTYDELKVLNPHGSVFCEALTIVVKTLEG